MILLEEIRKEILNHIKKDPKKTDYQNKEEDFNKYDISKEKYKDMIENLLSLEELEKTNLEIEFTNKETKPLWRKILCFTSSVRTLQPPGKSISYFVKNGQKIVGLVSLTSGQRDIKNRDLYIGWNKEARYKNIDYIFNISTCVAVQPLGYNFNIGKLLAMSVFSREVQEAIKSRYGHYAIGYYTFSIHGRSVQYERLKELKYVGLTQGKSFIITELLYEMMIKHLKNNGKYEQLRNSSQRKRRIIMTILDELGIPREKLHHHLERGIYVGYCFPDSKELFCNENSNMMQKELSDKIKSFNEIFEFWKERWARQRFNHLLKNKRVRHSISWSKKDNIEKNRDRQRKYCEKKRKELGEEEYKRLNSEKMKKYYTKKVKLHLTPEYYNKILNYKGEYSIPKVVLLMKNEIPDISENKVKKIWSGISKVREDQ